MFSAAARAALQRDRAELRMRAAVGARDVGDVADRVDARRAGDRRGPGARRSARRAPAAARPRAASGGALMPPPQTTQRVRIVVPSASVTWPAPTSVTATPRCSRTPLRPEHLGDVVVRAVRERRRAACGRGRRGGSAPRVTARSWYSTLIVSWMRSASAPASSTPVGPPPTTTKFSAPWSISAGSRSASSNTARMRERSRVASSSE